MSISIGPDWNEPDTFPTLHAEEVHVWLAVRPAEVEAAGLLKLLSPDERERAGRFHFEKDRTAFVAARARLRQLLGRYLPTAPEKIQFTTNAHGKPELPTPAPIQFNLSHSGDLAVFAFTRAGRVGVDVEQARPDFATDPLAERFFAPDEIKALRALPVAAQPAAFFDCWTRKEAFVKAHGAGLSLGLETFVVSVDGPARLLSVEGDAANHWTLHDLQPAAGYAGAVAVEAAHGALRKLRWS